MWTVVFGKIPGHTDEKLYCAFVAIAALVYIQCSEKYRCIINFIYDQINAKTLGTLEMNADNNLKTVCIIKANNNLKRKRKPNAVFRWRITFLSDTEHMTIARLVDLLQANLLLSLEVWIFFRLCQDCELWPSVFFHRCVSWIWFTLRSAIKLLPIQRYR